MANSGASKLAQVLIERIATQTQKADVLELGTIQSDMSLKLDRFSVPIPQGEYLVAEWLVKLEIPFFEAKATQTGLKDSTGGDVTGEANFSFQPANIDKVKLNFKADLKAGDRVLVAWVNDNTDPVVICKVVSS
ncbi:hypothetical protein [Caldicellulosiruptor hydrothermalis]|uniref:hypothetical protein n=1 Tax=Caldicellulosiruptor hydrothermalis TaxID=413888 RepID=UPI0011D0AD40|nr:hypothetical protein [Caldicellulosiruptor hydrothermalis]